MNGDSIRSFPMAILLEMQGNSPASCPFVLCIRATVSQTGSFSSGEFAGKAIRGLIHYCLPPSSFVIFVPFVVNTFLLSREPVRVKVHRLIRQVPGNPGRGRRNTERYQPLTLRHESFAVWHRLLGMCDGGSRMADVMRIENTSHIALPTSHIQRRFAVLDGTNQ